MAAKFWQRKPFIEVVNVSVCFFVFKKPFKKQILVLVMPRESFYIISRLMMTRFYFAEVPIVEKNWTR